MIGIGRNSYRLCLLDTCVVSEMLKSKHTVGRSVLDLVREAYVFCFSIYNVIELKGAPPLYAEFRRFFNVIPALLMKNYNQLLCEEIQAYSGRTKVDPVMCSLLADPAQPRGKDRIGVLFDSRELIAYEQTFDKDKMAILESILALMANYPARSGKYTKAQIEEFVDTVTLEQLIFNDRAFVQKQLQEDKVPDPRFFPSLQMSLYIVFYKFYLTNKRPVPSDVADLIMASLYPYVDAVVLEKNQAELLRQIKMRHNVVTDLEIMTLRDFRASRT